MLAVMPSASRCVVDVLVFKVLDAMAPANLSRWRGGRRVEEAARAAAAAGARVRPGAPRRRARGARRRLLGEGVGMTDGSATSSRGTFWRVRAARAIRPFLRILEQVPVACTCARAPDQRVDLE